MNDANTPRFRHYCECCTFLGQHEAADLYFCMQGSMQDATVIARYSDKGSDYQSGLVFADRIEALGEAKRRAIASGALKP
jgi:hypothetical protein